MRYQNSFSHHQPSRRSFPVRRGQKYFPPEPFQVKVSPESDPGKVAGSIAKALLDGRDVEAEVSGEPSLARLALALGIAQSFTAKNGGEMRVSVPEADLRSQSVRVRVTAHPLRR